MHPKKLSVKPLCAQKRRAAIGLLSQQAGDMEEERSPSSERPGREETRMLQPSVHPARVTLEALNMAAKLQHKMDRAERGQFAQVERAHQRHMHSKEF